VFLHGLTFDSRMWEPILSELPAAHRAIAVDLPGHGGSPPFAARGLAAVVHAVHAAVDAAAVDAPIVVGHSIGGPVASIYGSMHPSAGVVSIEAPIRLEPFAAMLHAAPQLGGPGFAEFWSQIDASMRVDLVPASYRELLREDAGQVQDLFLRYQADLLERPIEEVLRTFEAVDGFRMELVAREPLVQSPVAAAFDECQVRTVRAPSEAPPLSRYLKQRPI